MASPDLNIIENVWGIIKPALERTENLFCTNWVDKIEELWYNLEPEYLENLVDGMRARCEKVIASNGHTINH